MSLQEAIKDAVVKRATHLTMTGDVRNVLNLQGILKQALLDVARALRATADELEDKSSKIKAAPLF